MKTIDTLLKRGDLSALLQHDGMMQTAAGLIVPAASAEPFIKSEARKIAAEEDNKRKPYLFSQYALYQNMANWGARDKPRGSASLGDLQEAAKKSFIDAILIQARTDQNKMIWQRGVEGKQVGFKVVHERYDDPKFKPTEDVDRRCREMEEILSDPTPFKFKHLYPLKRQIHEGGLKDFISREVRAELIIDRKCMYRYKRRNGKGYAAFHWLPGESIKPVHEAIKEWASRNPDKSDPLRKITISQQTFDRMSATTGFDIANSDYVQIIDGQVTGAFTEDEISIHIANPSDEVNTFGWGYSRLEMSLDVTATLLYAWRYNQEIFKTNYPEQVLAITGNYDKQGLEAWKQQVLGEAGGPGNNWRLPIIASESGSEFGDGFDIKAFKLREAPKDMLFDQLFRMLVAIKCFKYDTIIETLEHGPIMIGKIVSKRMPCHVKSFDRVTGEVSWQKVIDWQKLRATNWVNLIYAGGDKRRSIDVTEDHDLWNGKEMVPAGKLQAGDTVYVKSPVLTYEQEQVLLGSLLGDGSIKKPTGEGCYSVPNITESHSESQRDYMLWKVAAYSNLGATYRETFTTARGKGTQKYACLCMATKTHPVLVQYRDICLNADGVKRVTWEWLSKLDALGLAIWFMDDGNFQRQKQQLRYSANITLMPGTPEEMSLYWRYFAERWGLHPRISPVKGKKCWRLKFSADETDRLRAILAPYMMIAPPISKYSGTKKQWHADPIPVGPTEGLAPVKIIKATKYQVEGGMRTYDVTVEGTHTLFANNLASSNCSAFGAHPSIVNFSVDSSGSSLMSHDPQSEIEFSKEHGFLPQLMDFCEWLSRAIVKPTYEDLKVIIIGLDDQSDKEKLDMVIAKVSKYVSRNDQLVAENLDPKGYWVSSEEYQKLSDEDKAKYDDNPWNYPADAPIATYITALGQKKMQEAMANGDTEPGNADQGNNEQVKKDQDPIQKAIPEPPRDVKFLRITIDDVARTGI